MLEGARFRLIDSSGMLCTDFHGQENGRMNLTLVKLGVLWLPPILRHNGVWEEDQEHVLGLVPNCVYGVYI